MEKPSPNRRFLTVRSLSSPIVHLQNSAEIASSSLNADGGAVTSSDGESDLTESPRPPTTLVSSSASPEGASSPRTDSSFTPAPATDSANSPTSSLPLPASSSTPTPSPSPSPAPKLTKTVDLSAAIRAFSARPPALVKTPDTEDRTAPGSPVPATYDGETTTQSEKPRRDLRAEALRMYSKALATPGTAKSNSVAPLATVEAVSTNQHFFLDNVAPEQAEATILDLAVELLQDGRGLAPLSKLGSRYYRLSLRDTELLGNLTQFLLHSAQSPLRQTYVSHPSAPLAVLLSREKLREVVRSQLPKYFHNLSGMASLSGSGSNSSLSSGSGTVPQRSSPSSSFSSLLPTVPPTYSPVLEGRPSFLIDSWAGIGGRQEMEDRVQIWENLDLLLQLPSPSFLTYVGVFDGHLGFEAAELARINLANNIARNSNFGTDLELAVKEGFVKTNKDIIDTGTTAGTTATALFLVTSPPAPGEKQGITNLVLSWVGDSKALLCSAGGVRELLNPHHPNREDESARIKAEKGCVVWFGTWRVNGVLAVSRSLGDKAFRDLVPPLPEIVSFDLQPTDEFVIVATDGLWDVFSADAAASFVKSYVVENGTHRGVAQRLVNEALKRESNDNTAVAVIFLNLPMTPAPLQHLCTKKLTESCRWKEVKETLQTHPKIKPELRETVLRFHKENKPPKPPNAQLQEKIRSMLS